jgi:Kre9/KNH-like N-terminal Ig-like domain/Viral BACON domain
MLQKKMLIIGIIIMLFSLEYHSPAKNTKRLLDPLALPGTSSFFQTPIQVPKKRQLTNSFWESRTPFTKRVLAAGGTSKLLDPLLGGTKNVISGCQILPVNNIWNTPIDTLPVDAFSSQYINTIGSNTNVHADFGSGLWDGGPIGIPFVTVPGSQPKVAVVFDYDDESDPGPYAIPSDAPIEGGSGSDGDRHVLVLDRDNCILYELYYAYPQGDGSWTAGSGAIYNLNSNALRPASWTSADAAGLPILPGLVLYDEVASGEIDHAIRFTVPQTQRKYVWPARHYASSLTGSQYPPMGQRFRLKADFDISGYSATNQVILRALKKYGMILADNGSGIFISGVPDSRWNNSDLHNLHNVKASNFEAVDVSSLMISANSGQALQGAAAKTITVTSPAGGESWVTGSTHTITWTSTGTITNVQIQLLKGVSSLSTLSASTSNDGSFSWTLSGSLSTGSDYQIKITDTSDSSVSDSGSSFSITVPSGSNGEIQLNRNQLNFGAVVSGSNTGGQHFLISNSGTGTLNWTISDNRSWLNVSPSSGSDDGNVFVSVNTSSLSTGSYSGTVTVSSGNASNSPQTVTVNLTVKNNASDQAPFGSFDTPTHGSTVRSSIAVTGWALDDVSVDSIKIYRQSGSNWLYIGDAVMVEGARSDIETSFPSYPNHYRGGWGYMLLTNFLPGGGNGTYVLSAVATDSGGHQTTLGTKTITCDNAGAVKPFGAIDTPVQGGIISGSSYVNFGWALTPQPNAIPTNGSTIDVYIDGKKAGNPVYNNYRADIATLFPGYANSNGAVGYFYIDSTQYDNGVHTIAWSVTDDANNIDGVGSRYFTVNNSGSRIHQNRDLPHFDQDLAQFSPAAVTVKKGFQNQTSPQTIRPNEIGIINIKIKPMQRIAIDLFGASSVKSAAAAITPLPIGSILDEEKGIFYWLPGPGFKGIFNLAFMVKDDLGNWVKRIINIEIVTGE